MKNFSMKKIFVMFVTFLFISIFAPTQATVLQGGVDTSARNSFCTVIDKSTKKPVPNAKITIPSKNFIAYTDINGHFELKTSINNQTILSVSKNNYKPFSMTINKGANIYPFVVEIETSTPFEISLETEMCHLGDNNFSTASANSGQFKGKSVGHTFSKKFFISSNLSDKQHFLVIGSIIGIDTALARGIGQNSITTSFASPPSVYLNGHKIAEIQINGDNQRIRLPKQLIKYNQNNTITIKAGRNLMQTAYVDYDDIEFINLSVQSKSSNNNHVGYKY